MHSTLWETEAENTAQPEYLSDSVRICLKLQSTKGREGLLM